jgi:large subunit ribosomal protein L12e
MRGKSKSIRYSGTVREILGTCTSIGCTVKYEGEVCDPKVLARRIREGEIDCGEYEAP